MADYARRITQALKQRYGFLYGMRTLNDGFLMCLFQVGDRGVEVTTGFSSVEVEIDSFETLLRDSYGCRGAGRLLFPGSRPEPQAGSGGFLGAQASASDVGGAKRWLARDFRGCGSPCAFGEWRHCAASGRKGRGVEGERYAPTTFLSHRTACPPVIRIHNETDEVNGAEEASGTTISRATIPAGPSAPASATPFSLCYAP